MLWGPEPHTCHLWVHQMGNHWTRWMQAHPSPSTISALENCCYPHITGDQDRDASRSIIHNSTCLHTHSTDVVIRWFSQWNALAMKWAIATCKMMARSRKKQVPEEMECEPFLWCSKSGRGKHHTLRTHRGWSRVQKRSGSLTIGLALALGRARGGFRSVLFLGSSDRNSLYSLSILYTLFCICCISHTYFLKETSRIHNLNYSKCEVGFFLNGHIYSFTTRVWIRTLRVKRKTT